MAIGIPSCCIVCSFDMSPSFFMGVLAFLAQDAQGSSCLSTIVSTKSPGLENGILKIRSVCIVCTLLLDLSMDRAREYVFVYTSIYIEIFIGSNLYICVCLFVCVYVIHKHTHKHTHSISMKSHWYLHCTGFILVFFPYLQLPSPTWRILASTILNIFIYLMNSSVRNSLSFALLGRCPPHPFQGLTPKSTCLPCLCMGILPFCFVFHFDFNF